MEVDAEKMTLFELSQKRRRRIIARNLAVGLLFGTLFAYGAHAGRLQIPAFLLVDSVLLFAILVGLFSLTTRIEADRKKISCFTFAGSQKSMDFAVVQKASICFANGRGPSMMLQLRAADGKALNIFDSAMTRGELEAMRDFVAGRCLEVTGKPIDVSDHTAKPAFIPVNTNTDRKE